MAYIDIRDMDTLEAGQTGAYYSIVGDLAGVGYMQQRMDDTAHVISNMRGGKFQAGTVAATAPASGTVWATPVYLPAGQTFHHITFVSGTTAGSAMTHQWFGLATSDLKIMATTTDDTSTAWAASSAKTLALSKVNNVTASAYTVPVTTVKNRPVLYYVLILVAGTTVPTLASCIASLYAVTTVPASGVTDQTSKTVPLTTDSSVTFAFATPNINVPWVGLD